MATSDGYILKPALEKVSRNGQLPVPKNVVQLLKYFQSKVRPILLSKRQDLEAMWINREGNPMGWFILPSSQ